MKKILAVVFMCVTCLSVCIPTYDVTNIPKNNEVILESVEPKAEETKWVFRIYNGKRQMRLWSITNQCWLTDWIDC